MARSNLTYNYDYQTKSVNAFADENFTTNMNIDFAELRNLDDVISAYDKICQEEDKAEKELENLLKQQPHLEAKVMSLQRMLPNLQLVHTDAKQLSSMVAFTSTLAENISSKVRQLDLGKSRVSECMQRVEDILDLKFCTDGVSTALENEDYEQAAAHIHRFLSLDESVLKRSAADSNEGSSLEEAFSRLHEAEFKLKTIVMQKFDKAVCDGDVASVERFFKTFPLLNQHAEGLKKFSTYLCSQITEAAQENLKSAQSSDPNEKRANVIYADTLTLLFESIARIVEIHQPLVETYYGHGRLLSVIEILQKECDRQVKKILDDFKLNRNFETKAAVVAKLVENPNEGEKLDPRELDVLLTEMTLINTRAELYLRFIRRRVSGDIEVASQEENVKQEQLKRLTVLIKDCELSRAMQELICRYITMEKYFMCESVSKAIILDRKEENPQTSNMVDDVFFILKKCIRRSLSSSSVDCVCAMLNHTCSLLEETFFDVLNGRIRQGFPSGGIDLAQTINVIQSSLQQGRLQASDTEKARAVYLKTLDNAEMACEYIRMLRRKLEEEASKSFPNSTEQEKAKLESGISDLSSVTTKFQLILNTGMTELCEKAITPCIETWVDKFKSTNHEVSEEKFSQYEANDGLRSFIQDFIMKIDETLNSFKASLSSSNYDVLVSLLATELTKQLEKAVLECRFNRLGGLQFDKELRALVTYLTSITTWTIRDKFARLTQIATILNLERVNEILDIWGSDPGSLTWRLTPTEVRTALKLRVDFKKEDIKKLKL
ncbi:conserved oligomeric Golgi complex subunit 4 [Tachypleus tridentatus]|uniref:conserved oligomeric Golgi complex subunit 4 n=1 Tax=Tachypleus tridentatus TaxID=6853 RepID=UPI003FD222E0